jgi:hypothetical protein
MPHSSKHLVLAIVTGLALSLLPSSPALAESPGSKEPGPLPASKALDDASRQGSARTAQQGPAALPPAGRPQPIKARGGASALKREVFGYADLANLNGSYATWDFTMLSTVALFGLHIQSDGNPNFGESSWMVWNSGITTNFVNTAHSYGVKVLITIVQLGPEGTLCEALRHSDITAAYMVGQVLSKGVDGISIDYEGLGRWCGGPSGSTQDMVTLLAQRIRQSLPPWAYISISTYAAAPSPPITRDDFFNVRALDPWVDSFFVMAYDSNFSNCSGCLAPTAPLNGYTWNQSRAANDYIAQIGPTKVLMGIPYYGYAACVANLSDPNQHIVRDLNAPRYLDAVDLQGDPLVSQFTAHRDARSNGQERWDTYVSGYWGNCNREAYWDDTVSLAAKYDHVNSKNLRGIGIWTLNYGGTRRELWDVIRTKLALIPNRPQSVVACPGDGFATVRWAPPESGAPFSGYTITGSPSGGKNVSGAAGTGVVTGLSNGTPYRFTVTAANQYGTGPISDQSAAVTPAPPPGSWPGQYHPLPPQRILDTRLLGRKLAPWETYALDVRGKGGVPATGVSAVIINVTSTRNTQMGFLTVYADQTCLPNTSNIDFLEAQSDAAALTETALGPNGLIDIVNSSTGTTDVVVDVWGYVSSAPAAGGDGRIRALTPSRIGDSRNGTGALRRLGARDTQSLAVRGAGGVPGNATAVTLNLTTTGSSSNSYLSIVPSGSAPAVVSNLNFTAGQTLANRVFVPLGPDGKVSIYNAEGSTEVVVDVTGWMTDGSDPAATGGLYTGVTPVRILDTRDGTGGWMGRIGPASRVYAPIPGQPGMPSSGVKLVVLNLTITDASEGSFLSVVPNATGTPGTSDINFIPNTIISNLVVAPVAPDGTIYIYNGAGVVHAIVDLLGWYG